MEQSPDNTESQNPEVERWLQGIFQTIEKKGKEKNGIITGYEIQDIIKKKTRSEHTLSNIACSIYKIPIGESEKQFNRWKVKTDDKNDIVSFFNIVTACIMKTLETEGLSASIPKLAQTVLESLKPLFPCSNDPKGIVLPGNISESYHSGTLKYLKEQAKINAENRIVVYDSFQKKLKQQLN